MTAPLNHILAQAATILEPPPDRDAAAWADHERILPPGSPEPGPWRSSRTPFMLPFAAACSDYRYSTIIFCCGAQMGKTENLLNVVGHRLTDGPFVPILLVFPTERLARSMSRDRFTKMIASTAVLDARMEKGQAAKVAEKYFSGIRCGFAHAGSATELSSHPAGLVVIDEIDRMGDVSREGDPFLLAKARTKNFLGSKVIVTSTPTIENASRIWTLWESGTMGRWSWPCPQCGLYFVPEFPLLRWPKGCTPEQALYAARLICPHCGGEMETKHRERANRLGRYEYCIKADNGQYENIGPEPPSNPTASFWASGLASPWQSFGQIAHLVLTAMNSRDQGTIQSAINTYLGECYKLRGDAPKWQAVKQHIKDYRPGSAPHGVQLITMGVDVQADRLYYVVRGYGYRGESWRLDAGEILGKTEFDQIWTEFYPYTQVKYSDIPIHRVFVDSGYVPGRDAVVRPDNKIYQFCRLTGGHAYPSKGQETLDRPCKGNKIDITISGRTIKDGLTLWHVNTDYFKRQLFANIRRDPAEPHGWHLDPRATDDYCKQVTAEECITLENGKRQWIKIRSDNHYLDCEVLADAAAYTAGVHNLAPLKAKERAVETPTPAVAGQPFVPPQQGSFFHR